MATVYKASFSEKKNYSTCDAEVVKITKNGTALDLSGAKASMVIREIPSGKIMEHLTTENSGLEITDEAGGELTINGRFLNYPNTSKVYGCDIRFELPGDVYKTYIEGTYPILATYQKPVE